MADGHDRGRKRGMRVALRVADRLYSGPVADTGKGTASVVFPGEGAPELPLGERVDLTFAGGPLEVPVTTGAVPVSRAEGDFRRYVFELDAAFGTHRTPPSGDRAERRQWLRVAPDRPVTVRVEIARGPHAGALLEGRLGDLSHGGLAAVLRADAEARLHTTTEVRCTLRPPGAAADETWTCAVRNRQLLGDEVRYGLAFVRPSHAAALRPPTFEHFWRCAGCHTDRLLAVTHAHCPQCGRARGLANLRFPGWDEVLTADDHPFAGADRRCACGATWSAAAHHCGACGAALKDAVG